MFMKRVEGVLTEHDPSQKQQARLRAKTSGLMLMLIVASSSNTGTLVRTPVKNVRDGGVAWKVSYGSAYRLHSVHGGAVKSVPARERLEIRTH
eukprot:scaffold256443_cov33-Tisochrysis_lutea.AAC.1